MKGITVLAIHWLILNFASAQFLGRPNTAFKSAKAFTINDTTLDLPLQNRYPELFMKRGLRAPEKDGEDLTYQVDLMKECAAVAASRPAISASWKSLGLLAKISRCRVAGQCRIINYYKDDRKGSPYWCRDDWVPPPLDLEEL